MVRVFNLRRLGLRLLAKNDPLEFSSIRTGADIARTKGGRFWIVKAGEICRFRGECRSLVTGVDDCGDAFALVV